LGTKITKIQELKLQKFGNKNLGTKVKKTGNKIKEQKFQNSRNKN
jgi:hypothetical protein